MTATQPTTKPTNQARKTCGGNAGLTQAYEMRDQAARMAAELSACPAETLQDKAARARALRDCNAVWDRSMDVIRIIRGKPLPGSLRPVQDKGKKSKQPQAAPMEWIEPEPDETKPHPMVPGGGPEKP